jgi:hypothetical protein
MTLHRLPRQLPPPAVLTADLGDPSPLELGPALGVSARTVWRWQLAGEWPRAAHLAVFFASRWGWSAVQADALHAVQLAEALSRARSEECSALRAAVARMEALQLHGSANAPFVRAG